MASPPWILGFPSAKAAPPGDKITHGASHESLLKLTPALVFQLPSLNHPECGKSSRGGGEGGHRKQTFRSLTFFLKLFLSSTPECKNRNKEIDFLPLYCPSFYSKPPRFWQLEWQNSTVAFFLFISLRKFYREARIAFCSLVCFAGWFCFIWFVLQLFLLWFVLFVCFSHRAGKENVKENIPKKPPKLYSGNCIGSLKMLEVVEINIQENLKGKIIKHKSIL